MNGNQLTKSELSRPYEMESETILKGNIIIPPPFWNGTEWVEWIPWDEI